MSTSWMRNRYLVLWAQIRRIRCCAKQLGTAVPRLFVAIRLPDTFKSTLRELQSGLSNARWLQEDGLHLTLAFIGETDLAVQHRIEAELGSVTAPALNVELHKIGCFPPRGAPRVLWVGVEPMTELAAIAESVRSALRRADIVPERRKFMPHVTLARFRRPPPGADLKRYLAACSAFRTHQGTVASFQLFSSDLQTSGAHYSIEKNYLLTDARRESCDPA